MHDNSAGSSAQSRDQSLLTTIQGVSGSSSLSEVWTV